MIGTLFLVIFLLLLAVIFFFTRNKQPIEKEKTSQEINNWEYQRTQSKKESTAEQNKEWFTDQRWLTDTEIDWVTTRIIKSEQYKILPAHQFHYVAETKGTAEANAQLAFPELLSELNCSQELVFIPVNNPDFHWSLLVYETQSKKFYHFDTSKGANYEYVRPLVQDLLTQILATNHPKLDKYLIKLHELRQSNGSDCGVAVIAIIKRITNLWGSFRKNSKFNLQQKLGTFDFTKERKELRSKYLQEK